MNSFFKTFFACLLAIVASSIVCFLLFIALLAGIASIFSGSQAELIVPPGSVLRIDLSVPLIEKESANPLDNIDLATFKVKPTVTLREAVAAIEKAAIDPNISGIAINVPMSIPSSTASLYELREALKEFKASEKFIVSYGDYISQGGLYIASIADKIYLNPQGGIAWIGMSSNVTFFKGTLEKLGVRAEIFRHGKFKGAVEPLIREDLSPENRQQIESITSSIWGYVVGSIAESRNIDPAKLNAYASDLSVDSAEKAVELGLADELFYHDQFTARLAHLTGNEKPNVVNLTKYKYSGLSTRGDVMSKNTIALVYAEGDIVDKGEGNKGIVGSALAADLAKLRADSSVKAVVFRINSPGGSALAADIIWREVDLIRQSKPIVVSMNGTAASGGYYIACAADRIITTPVTITGSIGVFGILLNVEKGAKDLLGLTTDVVNTNPSAGLGSVFHNITPAERNFIQAGVDRIYTRFATVVANGRSMRFSEVDSIGQGRIWSGLQATEIKLADRTGTLNDAIKQAAELAAIDDYRIKSYPEVDNSFRSLFMSLSEASVNKVLGGSKSVIDEISRIQKIFDRQGIRAEMPYDLELIY